MPQTINFRDSLQFRYKFQNCFHIHLFLQLKMKLIHVHTIRYRRLKHQKQPQNQMKQYHSHGKSFLKFHRYKECSLISYCIGTFEILSILYFTIILIRLNKHQSQKINTNPHYLILTQLHLGEDQNLLRYKITIIEIMRSSI